MTNENRNIAVIEIDGNYVNIKASGHAMERMNERGVDKYVIAGSVLALGPERIAALQASREEAIIIDEVNNVSVVIGCNPKTVTIITVIGKSNIFVKNNTQIYNL